MRIIHAIDRPFQHAGRDYYWDARYAKDELREGRTIQCKMPVNDDDKLFKHSAPASANKSAVSNGTFVEQALLATFTNETRPKEIVWTCKWAEYCCGTECCPLSGISTTTSAIILSIGWCLLIVGFCVWNSGVTLYGIRLHIDAPHALLATRAKQIQQEREENLQLKEALEEEQKKAQQMLLRNAIRISSKASRIKTPSGASTSSTSSRSSWFSSSQRLDDEVQ
uniref:CX domain-containing protein n=1 Tax=Globodera pallida TaxID=36090 RepID=A0A183BME3_GLOPA